MLVFPSSSRDYEQTQEVKMVEAVIHDTAAEYQFVIYSLLYQLNLKPLAGATLLARVILLAIASTISKI